MLDKLERDDINYLLAIVRAGEPVAGTTDVQVPGAIYARFARVFNRLSLEARKAYVRTWEAEVAAR